tara:strand:+ start:1879 stop:2286 length:408 start_codon:yes stop_codon:yes gene_type:complete
MGLGNFMSSLGQKVSGEVGRLGNKVHHAIRKGEKFMVKHGDTISKVAGAVGNVAGMAAAGIAATGIGAPLAGAVAGVAAASKGIERGASALTSASRAGLAAEDAVRQGMRGNIGGAIRSGRTAISQGRTARNSMR